MVLILILIIILICVMRAAQRGLRLGLRLRLRGKETISMSTAELAKTYDPSSVEAETYRVWLEENCFQADPAKPGEPFSIVIPPPNVTGALHLGHAINNTLQDILIRAHRMRGFNTVWIPGIDHRGIATQAVVEKQL